MVQIRAKALIIENGPRGIVVLNAPKVDAKGKKIPGDAGDLPDMRAQELVDAGMAEFVDAPAVRPQVAKAPKASPDEAKARRAAALEKANAARKLKAEQRKAEKAAATPAQTEQSSNEDAPAD